MISPAGEMQAFPVSSSPSFNCYSDVNLTDIAARVVKEFPSDSEFLDDFFCRRHEDEEHGEFDFAFVPKDSEFSVISADQIFCNGQIRPVFPIFGLFGDAKSGNGTSSGEDQKIPGAEQPIRMPLRKLLDDERENGSESDELVGIPAGTYCVWRPKEEEASLEKCKKSNSAGSSKRWRLRDLLYRSHSDGKGTFLFLTHSSKKGDDNIKADKKSSRTAGKSKPTCGGEGAPTDTTTLYTKNRAEEMNRTGIVFN